MAKQKLNLNAIIITSVIVIGIVALVYFLTQNQSSSGNTVSATGNANLSVMPDKAVISLMIQTKNVSAQVAKNENAEISEKVISELNKLGIQSSDTETENYNIYPEYDYTDGSQKLIGYVASNYISVNTLNFDDVGKIVDASVDAGALVNYINFDLSTAKSNEYKAMILANASLDAKNKAESVAAGLGKRLGTLVSVTASDYNYFPYPLYRAETAGAGTADLKQVTTNISPQKLDLTGTVSVTYKII